MTYRYPVLLDVSNRLCVIIGGGKVGARKAAGLIAAGATRVKVVSPDFSDETPPDVDRVVASYDRAHLQNADLVFAATSSNDVNDAVVRDAQSLGLWVNRADADADDDLAGDFTLPAVARQGDSLIVAVSAGGAAALSAEIRDRLAERMDEAWGLMADAMKTLRPRIRNSPSLGPRQRRVILLDLAKHTEALRDVLVDQGAEGVWNWLVRRNPQLAAAPGDTTA